MLDEDGKIITEEKTIQIPMYKPVTVFDVSQTEGKPLPQLAHDLSGNVANYDVFMEALRRSSPVPISIEVMRGGMDGYFDLEHQDIAIRKGMSEVQTVSAVIHEMAHALLHNRTKDTEEKNTGNLPQYRGGAGGKHLLCGVRLLRNRHRRKQLRLYCVLVKGQDPA